MEMLSVSAILLGAYLGCRMFDTWAVLKGGPWQGALDGCRPVRVFDSWLAVLLLIRRTEPQSAEPFSPELFVRHGAQIIDYGGRGRSCARRSESCFLRNWFLREPCLPADRRRCAPQWDRICLRHQRDAAGHGLGAILGNLAAGALSRRSVELGLVPVGRVAGPGPDALA